MRTAHRDSFAMAVTALAAVLLTLPGTTAQRATADEGAPAVGDGDRKPVIEAVFVLDTTGSMSGLIAGAKEKIWSIANTLATAKPAPTIRIGLVGYRDRGDQYITVSTPLSSDLDAVYGRLMEFKAGGGGDMPESVNQALNEAVARTQWNEGREVYRVVFLVGDCPPHMDYQDDVKYPTTCRLAKEKGIFINTILCGGNQQAMEIWKDIASKGSGTFLQVGQEGDAIVVKTPHDEKLAELSRQLDRTRLFYGSTTDMERAERRKETADRLNDTASLSVQAQRAVFNSSASGAANFAWEKDLVSDYENDKDVLARVSRTDLPKDVARLSDRELAAKISELSNERKRLQAEIRSLSDKRQAFIQEEVAKTKGKKEKSLEFNIYRTVKKQAAESGVIYDAKDAVY